ncbi:MAG: DUF4956 domain-containing protein [Clostridia bacterium]|nr:DUF4956 domain-containing protein [Clostridia bacterium]MBR6039277.1 DUF4956 domain-containing protein [Clostridia bacterium]
MEQITDFFATELSAVSLSHLLLCVGLSFALSLYIVFIYRLVYSGVMFSKRFSLSLMMLSLVTSVVILAISSNVVLSLGMVGALSIVRFRTAVKDVMDTVFMFWAIVNGIICGAGFVLIAVLAALGVGILILAVYYFGRVAQQDVYLVVVRAEDSIALNEVSPLLAKGKMKSCSSAEGVQEIVSEMKLSNEQVNYLRKLTGKDGVISVDIVAYNTKTGL